MWKISNIAMYFLDYIIVGSDSGRIVILEYNPTKNVFDKVHQETYGKSGCRRIVPGQYLAIDPKGRAVMISKFSLLVLFFISVKWWVTFLSLLSPSEEIMQISNVNLKLVIFNYRYFHLSSINKLFFYRCCWEAEAGLHLEPRCSSSFDHFLSFGSPQVQHFGLPYCRGRCWFWKSSLCVPGNGLRRGWRGYHRRSCSKDTTNFDFLRARLGVEPRGPKI